MAKLDVKVGPEVPNIEDKLLAEAVSEVVSTVDEVFRENEFLNVKFDTPELCSASALVSVVPGVEIEIEVEVDIEVDVDVVARTMVDVLEVGIVVTVHGPFV